jgi:hypothetical protein
MIQRTLSIACALSFVFFVTALLPSNAAVSDVQAAEAVDSAETEAALTTVAKSLLDGNLSCTDITGCCGAASCGEPGKPEMDCDLNCESGTEVSCTEANEQGECNADDELSQY